MTTTEKLLCTGKTHVTAGPTGSAHSAHGICPYSKAVHGNIDITTTLV